MKTDFSIGVEPPGALETDLPVGTIVPGPLGAEIPVDGDFPMETDLHLDPENVSWHSSSD